MPIFNQDLKDLAARGADFIQIEDLGAAGCSRGTTTPGWIIDVLNALDRRRRREDRLALLPRRGYGNTFRTVEDALPRVLERWQAVNVEQFALDFALRDMVGRDALKELEPDREVQVGVIDIRTSTSRPTTRSSSGSTRCSTSSQPSASTCRPTAG